jgi:periplasmic glucans biosynthesis protein
MVILSKVRALFLFGFLGLLIPTNCLSQDSDSFSFDSVKQIAKELSSKPYDAEPTKISGDWLKISYDDFRSIRYRAENALFKKSSPFEIQFFHPGFIFDRTVKFSTVDNGKANNVPFHTEWFNYEWGGKEVPKIPVNMRYSGFRVHYPLHSTAYKDELLVFLGASYFKFLGRGQKYGLSTRGLAIDTAADSGEEFPYFTDFWVVKGDPKSHELLVYALLDSPSVAGAYSFVFRPGANTYVDIKSVLYPRKTINKMGVAPLTSMFLYGENKTKDFDDFRPEVHDSDGLLLRTGSGEWIWRPLVNRQWVNLSLFLDNNPKGFGLLQRDRSFQNYQDIEAFYEERPSYWVEPLSDWGQGHIELVEIPTNSETNDNIVAYWVPKNTPKQGDVLEFAYRITAMSSDKKLHAKSRTVSSRIGSAERPGSTNPDKNARIFVLDFEGEELDFLSDSQPVEGNVWNSSGKVGNIISHKNRGTGGWRLTFDFYPEKGKHSDFRVFLKLGDTALTETWTYLWTPPLPQ